MASQLVATTGNRRLRRDQNADVNARMGYLPQMAGLAQEKELAEKRMAMDEKRLAFEEKRGEQQLSHQKEQLAFEEEAEKKRFGLEIAKLGIGAMGSGVLGDVMGLFGFGNNETTNATGAVDPGDSPVGGGATLSPAGSTGMFSGSIGDIAGNVLSTGLGSGLLGFGAGSLFSEGGAMGAGIGALAGMAPGIISGLGSFFGTEGATLMGSMDFGKIFTGGLFGGLGGFASGMF